MVPLGVGQPQGPRDGVEHLGGHVVAVALLQPRVVRDGHPGELRQLLAAQPGDAAVAAQLRQAHVLRLQPGTAGAEEFAEFGALVHTASITGRGAGRVLTLPVVGTPDVGRTGGWVSWSATPAARLVEP